MKKFVFPVLFAALMMSFGSEASACVWVDVGNSFLECRTPYREFFGSTQPERRRRVLRIAFQNAQRRIHQMLNESEILSLLLESDSLYSSGNTDAVSDLITNSERILEMTNQITMEGNNYLLSQSGEGLFESEIFDPLPSAYLVGITIPSRRGLRVPLSSVMSRLGRGLPDVQLSGGSLFFAAVIVPQIVEYVAEYRPSSAYQGVPGGQTVYEDPDYRFRIYDVANSTESRLRLNDIGYQVYPTADLKVELRTEGTARVETREGGLQPTVAFVWGRSIYRPDHVGKWGFSYSLPTAMSRIPWSSVSQSGSLLAQGSILGQFALTRHLTWGFLRALDLAGVNTAKLSWNSSRNVFDFIDNLEEGVSVLPFDQVMVNIRWSDVRRRAGATAQAESPAALVNQARVGLNFNLASYSALGGATAGLMDYVQETVLPGDREPVLPTTRVPPLPVEPEELARRRLSEVEGRLFQQSLAEAIQGAIQELPPATELSQEQIQALVGEVQRMMRAEEHPQPPRTIPDSSQSF